ncbi:MFS transporter [Nonomuraea typhae]|uniref:MFS transporter n=1 Tax=Nonomuraea typhae TaxID=2603600 RepID=UPI0012F9A43D|nr:MFS transporter [Nonomuraea typhae]
MGSHLANEFGANIARVALPLVAVLSLHASPLEVGALAALQSAAFLIISLPAGAWVDRMRKRRVMLVSDVARFLLLGSIPLTAALGLLSMPILYGVALLVGLAQVFNDVADVTYLPSLVGKDQLSDGNAKLEVIRNTGALAGPSLSGALVQLLGAPRTMLATALGALTSAILLGSIKKPDSRPPVSERSRLLPDIALGLRTVWADPVQRVFLAATAATNICISAVVSLSVLFLATVVQLPPGIIGVLLMSGAFGGLLGGLLGTWLFKTYGTARVTWLALTLTSPFGLLLPMTQSDWRVSCFAVTSIVLSFGAILFNIGMITYRQTVTPESMLGRVNATVRFIVLGTMPVGAMLGGIVAHEIGVREALWVFLTGRLISFLPLLFSRLPYMRDFAEVQAKS